MATENADSALLSVAIEDGAALHAAHMPFVVHGGLFIPTPRRYRLGEEVFVLLRLMQDPHRLPLAGRVVWITPAGASGGKPPGVGVQFGDHDDVVRRRIAACLADYPDVTDDTYTL
ncbi:MAG: pilus assembly protein PilZ [Gammaproteobacteria bacterium]|nr:pilus assembly protein PilZ [Gammaproteobacteria bacterium]MYF27582.1 pilus assembly protein PilZ [Gammaproteobacteria bacterium]MYK46116.1 pilus assembly protein PilZ [Gammaproteobacteria bacterium]